MERRTSTGRLRPAGVSGPATGGGGIGRHLDHDGVRRAQVVPHTFAADALGVDQHTLGATLRRLRARGLLDKQGAYWFVPTARDGARLAGLYGLTRSLNERLGPEKRSDWPRMQK